MKNSQKTLTLGLLIGLGGFPKISETIYTPALPSVASSLQTTPSMVEETFATYFLGYAVGVCTWGTISDVFGRRYAMLFGLLVYTVATLFCGAATTIESLLSWRFFQAFGASVGSVIIQTMVRDVYEANKRTKLFSIGVATAAFCPAIGPLLGGVSCEFFGWRVNFWFLALLSAALFIWAYLRLPETRPENIPRLSLNRFYLLFIQMITSRKLWGHILLIGATGAAVAGFYQEAPFVFIDQLGISPSSYGLFGLLISAATILAAKIAYQKSHISSEFMILCGSLCVFVGGCLLTLMVMLGMFDLQMQKMAIVVFMLFLIFFGLALITPNSLSLVLEPYKSVVGIAGSIFGGLYYCFVTVCTWLLSIFHDETPLPFL